MTAQLKKPTLEEINFTYQQALDQEEGKLNLLITGRNASYSADYTVWELIDRKLTAAEIEAHDKVKWVKTLIHSEICADLEADFYKALPFLTQAPVIELKVEPGIVGRVTAADFRMNGYAGTVDEADIETLAGTVREILFKSGIWREAVDDALIQMRIIDAEQPRVGALITAAERINIDGLTIPLGTVGEIVSFFGGGKIEATFEGAADAEVCYELTEQQYRILRCDNNFKVQDIVVFTNDATLLRDVPKGKNRRAIGRLHVEKGQIALVKHWRNQNAISVQVMGQPPSEWYTVDPLTICVVSGEVEVFKQWFEDFTFE